MSITFSISLITNIFIHNAWVNDSITDFIAFSPGAYSILGIWHLIFSTLQTEMLYVFILVWYISLKTDIGHFNSCVKIWIYIFIFTLLGFADMTNKYLFIFDKPFIEVLKIDQFAFVTPSFALIIILYFTILKKHLSKSSNNTYEILKND